MVRPILTLLSAVAVSGRTSEDTLRFAAAAELLHNATLFHDDVADNSPTRRGKPTVMSVLGGRASVLLGDYWLVKAMDMIFQADKESEKVLRIFSKTLGDLAEGEMLQLEKAGSCDTTLKDYLTIIYKKTASLFEASALSAAISVGTSEQQKEAIRIFAVKLGLAFQIKDDIMDYNGGDVIGKPLGQDLEEQKITMPLLCAMEGSSKEKMIRRKLSNIGSDPLARQEIVDFVIGNGGIEKAERYLENEVFEAVEALSPLQDGKAKEMLSMLAKFVSNRNN